MQEAEEDLSQPAAVRRIFIVEDHPVFREGMILVINREPDLKICGQAASAEEALTAFPPLAPDLLLVDITLPGKNGLEFIKELRQSNREVKVLVVSMHDEALYADRVLRVGGDGYIMKEEAPEEIVHAIRDVLDGHIYVSEEVMAASSKALQTKGATHTRPLDLLTDLELEILELLGQGNDKEAIARQLHSTAKMVSSQCTQIRKKLDFKNTSELVHYAVNWVKTGTI
jgi:DNA-binding NarL/FixJ family response regulator